ncbi:LysR family transcriptional regulator [Rhizobium halophytocola]|uniref:DNA-binding transcriptional LysR family regulator n=1 Tax=Rhizobium halophytocola TaxID=735519 RepID=A0ABS4E5S8_9HYPH|nr:LysR family transcriptional regulator [Rhizobium halophytocola]MBP1853310.1 DNA-binding transcriptional LysR family regulator [Rhizobium halophytocola]
MNLRFLKTFVAVAETGSMTRAGLRVHLSQSSVSEQIQALEQEFGTALFDRARRRLSLTAAGERLLAHAPAMLGALDQARADIAASAGNTAGALAVGGLETLCAGLLPPLLARYRAACPQVALTLATDTSVGLRAGIASGDLDIAFLFGPPGRLAGGRSETLSELPLAVLAPAGHRLATGNPVPLSALGDETFLVTGEGCVFRAMFEQVFAGAGVRRPAIGGTFASIAAVRRLVEAGMGLAIVPGTGQAAGDDRLAALAVEGLDSSVALTMLWRKRPVQPPALLRFLAESRARFAAA